MWPVRMLLASCYLCMRAIWCPFLFPAPASVACTTFLVPLFTCLRVGLGWVYHRVCYGSALVACMLMLPLSDDAGMRCCARGCKHVTASGGHAVEGLACQWALPLQDTERGRGLWHYMAGVRAVVRVGLICFPLSHSPVMVVVSLSCHCLHL